jgi:hypothetical protein
LIRTITAPPPNDRYPPAPSVDFDKRTAGFGATLSFPCFPAKVPSPSDLPTFVNVHCQCVVFEFTTYALVSCLRASWMEATRRSMTTGPVFRCPSVKLASV